MEEKLKERHERKRNQGGSLIPKPAPGGSTALSQTGEYKKKRERLPESGAAAVDGYHMLQVKVEKLLPDP